METPSEAILGHLNPHPLGLVKGMASKSQGGVSQESTHQETDAPMAFRTLSRGCFETQSVCLENIHDTGSREHAKATYPLYALMLFMNY